MDDFLQQSKKQGKLNEGLFDKVFGKKQSQQPVVSNEQHLKQYGFYRNENGSFVFGDGSIAEQVNSNEPSLIKSLEDLNLPNNPKLSFLVAPGTKFHAKKIEINISSQEVEHFKGEWNAGNFNGVIFEGVFRGNSFRGDFQGMNSDYQAKGREIISFVDGTFIDGSNSGLLGMTNTLNTNIDDFNFITIPVGYSLSYVSKSGVKGYIKVLKRLDGVNSDFSYEILDGFVGHTSPQIINKEWQYFRQNAASGMFNINKNASINIGGLVHVLEGDSISEMNISQAPVLIQPTVQPAVQPQAQKKFEPGKQYSFNLATLPYPFYIKSIKDKNGKFIKPDINIRINSPEEFKQFDYIKSGTLEHDISSISKAIKHKEVDGYGPFNYLDVVFNSNPGKNIFNLFKKPLAEAGGVMGGPQFNIPGSVSTKTGKLYQNTPVGQKNVKPSRLSQKPVVIPKEEGLQYGTIPSMKRLNDFIRYFVENIKDSYGEPNEEIQNLILSQLKSGLGTDSIKTPEVTAPIAKAEPSVSQEPGMTSSEIGKAFTAESLRNAVRNIINESF